MKSTATVYLGLVLFAGADAASASTFQFSSYSVTNEQNITISAPKSVSGEAGQIVLTGSGDNAGQILQAWCLDIYDFLANSGTYNVGLLTTGGSGGSNPALTPAKIGEIGALITHGNALINTSHDVSAAIQLAIWEVEYGNAFSYHGITPSVSALAAIYVTDVQNGTWAPNNNVSLLSEAHNQTLGYVTPLPSSWFMMLPVLAGFGFLSFCRESRSARIA